MILFIFRARPSHNSDVNTQYRLDVTTDYDGFSPLTRTTAKHIEQERDPRKDKEIELDGEIARSFWWQMVANAHVRRPSIPPGKSYTRKPPRPRVIQPVSFRQGRKQRNITHEQAMPPIRTKAG